MELATREQVDDINKYLWTMECLAVCLFKRLVEKNVISRDDLNEIFEDAKGPMPGETRHSETLDNLLENITVRLAP